jgi:hypothetical protein
MAGFADTIDAAIDDFFAMADRVPRLAADIVGERIIAASPVGNPASWKRPAPKDYVAGRFRSNWNVGVDAIDRTLTKSTNIFTVNGLGKVEGFGHRYFISNASPQAWRIEIDGWSTQAPRGVIGVLPLGDVLALAVAKVRAGSGSAER